MYYETIIIGAGAAGLFCGASLQKYNHSFLILDQSVKAGIKLLASGSGQCNFTHDGNIKDFIHYYGTQGKRIRGILYRYNNQMTESFFHQRGVETITRKDGKVFPASFVSEDIRSCLIQEIKKNHGEILCQRSVFSIDYNKDSMCYTVFSKDQIGREYVYTCKNLVIATGGKSYPKTGSDGKIKEVLQSFDSFEWVEQRPALVPIYVENYAYASLSGISIKNAKIRKGKITAQGDLLFTHKNFSGPLILNFSRYLDPGDPFEMDYLPDGFQYGEHIQYDKDKKTVLHSLVEQTKLSKAMLEVFLKELNIDMDQKICHLKKDVIQKIERTLRHHLYIVNGKAGLDKAMVTAGGIALFEVSTRTLESKKHKGLYFIGEILDVDGDTGGYNIQFAFSSGYAAAQHIIQGS